MENWKTEQLLKLCEALQSFSNTNDLANFLRDLLTEAEMKEFSGRFAVAQALAEGKSQRVVSTETGVSIATVTRVNQWLLRGMGGYKQAITEIGKQFHRPHQA